MVAAFSYIIKKCIPPHPSRYTLDTFSRLGEGFYRYALCKKLGCSCQLPHSTTPDSYIQLCPRGTLIADQRRACAARPKGKYSRGRMALAPIRTREFSLPRGPIHRPRLPVLFQQLSRHTQPSLILSWSPRKNRSPSSLLPFVPPRPTQKPLPMGGALPVALSLS